MRERLSLASFFLSLSLVAATAEAAIPATERTALLAFFNATGGPEWNDKSGWGGAAGTECDWKGVTCSNDAVTELWLPDNNLSGTLPPSISALTRLEVLYLPVNRIGGSLPATLTTILRLRTLSLSINELTGPIPSAIGDLADLVHLELAGNHLTGELPASISRLSRLESLTLYSNRLSGALPSFIGSLSALTYVSLADNDFTGPIPPSLGGLAKLEELYLGDNQLEGTIPGALGQLPQLRTLQLDYNKLNGTIPASLGSLQNLELLALGFNELSGTIPPQLGNLANIQRIELFINKLEGSIPPSLGNLKKLEQLQLEHNKLSGALPQELGAMTSLKYLALGYNDFTGNLPVTLGALTTLEELTLEQNQIEGTIPQSFSNLSSLRKLDVSGNRLIGPLPDLSDMSNLRQFAVSYNAIGGQLPLWIAELPNIEGIYFDDTRITGVIPDAYASLATLRDFHVSGNALTGRIPEWIGDLRELRVLLLAGNRFIGALPESITRLSNLFYLHLGDNRLRGELPSAIGDLQQLAYFEINGNAFSGRVPESFSSMKNLVYVVFAGNEFIGEMPRMEGFDQLELLNLSVNHFTGTFPVELTRLPKLQVLSLGGNLYKGPLPDQIGDFPILEFLGLWSNGFMGEIPASIMKLNRLQEGQLDLDHNGLYTSSPAVREFVTSKQYDKEWEKTQTIAPTKVSVHSITDRSVEVRWQPIPYIYDQGGYRVAAFTSPGERPVAVVTTPEKESSAIVVRGLQPETTYYFTVAAVTHPHDYQQNLIVSAGSAPVSARTTARVLAPAEVAITRTPVGLIQIGGVPQNEDGFILTNFGDQTTNITLHPGHENFFTVAPLTFSLAGGASQRVKITSIPQPVGSYWSGIGIEGAGVPQDLGVYFELLSVAAPTGTVVGEALSSRIDLSGAADGSAVATVTYANRGTSELRGVLVSNVPWIVTTPGLLAIPPNEQRTVNFTVDRSKRTRDISRGSATGLLSLVYIDGGAPGISLKEITSMDGLPAGVSVSVVTVVDTAKPSTAAGTIPPLGSQEIARFVPGVRSTTVSGRNLVSDLSIANAAGVSTTDDVRLYFTTPANTSATVAPLGSVTAQESISLSNVVASVYGGSSPNGSLQLRSDSWDKLTVAAVLNSLSASGNGGTALPIFRSDRSADSGEALYLVGVGKSSTLRGDVILQETAGGAARTKVEFFGANGAAVGTPLQFSLAPFGMAEASDAIPAGAVTAVVKNEGGAGDVVAYVQMLDLASGDGWTIVDWSRYFDYDAGDAVRVPLATKASGETGRRKRPVRPGSTTSLAATVNAQIATDLYVFNSGATDGAARLRFIDRSGTSSEVELEVSPGATLVLDDVLARSFNKSSADGVLLVDDIDGALAFSSRTRSAGVGSSVPVVAATAGLRLGESQLFAGISDAREATVTAREAGTYNTALRLQETSGASAKVRVSLLFADGRSIVSSNISRDFDLPANQLLNIERISREIIGSTRDADFDDLFGMQLRVRVVEGEGSVLPLVVVTENASADTFVRVE